MEVDKKKLDRYDCSDDCPHLTDTAMECKRQPASGSSGFWKMINAK